MAFPFYPAAWDMGEVEQLDARTLLVLLAVVEHANSEGRCWPSQARLARYTRMSESTVRRCLKRLEGLEIIERKKRSRPDGQGRSSDEISLCFPPLPVSVTAKGANGQNAPDLPVSVTGEPVNEALSSNGARRGKPRSKPKPGLVTGPCARPEVKAPEGPHRFKNLAALVAKEDER